MKKIALLSCSLNTDNRGVSALGASLVQIINSLASDSEITILAPGLFTREHNIYINNNKQIKVKEIDHRLSLRNGISRSMPFIFIAASIYRIFRCLRSQIKVSFPAIKTIVEAEMIGDICGGDSFSDIYGTKKFLMLIFIDIIVLILKRNLIYLPQTYGPFFKRFTKIIAGFLLKNSSKILSRDQKSITYLNSHFKNKSINNKISFCPDVAFMLQSVLPQKIQIIPPLSKDKKIKRIGLNISGLLYIGGFTRNNMFNLNFDYITFIKKLIKKLLSLSGFDLILVPHTYHPEINGIADDLDACEKIIKDIDSKSIHLVNGHYDQNEIKGIISLCDFFIGSRMHSCIAALSQGIPTIGVAYSRKFIGIFNSINLSDMVIDAASVTESEAIQKIMNEIANYSGKKFNTKIIDDVQQYILKTFKALI